MKQENLEITEDPNARVQYTGAQLFDHHHDIQITGKYYSKQAA